MPNINEMLLKLKVTQYATSIDLNMGYYHISITGDTSNLCAIILTWEKYFYKCLPMAVSTSPENSQHKINNLLQWFEFVNYYIDDILY